MKPFSPGSQIILLIALLFSALYVVGPLLFVLTLPLIGPDEIEAIDMSNPTLAYFSGFFGLFAMFLVCFIMFLRVTKQHYKHIIHFSKWDVKTLAVVLGLLLVSWFLVDGLYLVNKFLIELAPRTGFIEMEAEFNEKYEAWFSKENRSMFPIALFVFAVMPAIVEELIFRGVLLKKLQEVSNNNVHFSVIVSAALFAAFHMQAWNLLPMIGMGVIFGYVYVFTKDIRYTMLMHFLFNGVQIAFMFYAPELVT